MNSVIVVGAGLAGANVAFRLRRLGYEGGIALIGQEKHEAYDRPPLSKDVLLNSDGHPRRLFDLGGLRADVRLGTEATALRRCESGWAVETTGGEFRGDRVVVATGARARPLQVRDGHRSVFTLRTVDDALALRARLRRGVDVAVVGAGWIGAEVASSAAALGCRVTVVEAQAVPMAGSLGSAVGARMADWHRDAGVRLSLGARVTGLVPGAVELDSGERVAADVVVAGVGMVPNTEWLAGTVKVGTQGRIVVDPHLETSAPGVYAIGDCAAYFSRRYGCRLRPEHWTSAQLTAWAVASTLMGEAEAYDPVPYVWSQQFGHMLQYAGHHAPGDEISWRAEDGKRAWSACWTRAGELTAVLAVNNPVDAGDARRLLASGAHVDGSRLPDPSIRLKECLVG